MEHISGLGGDVKDYAVVFVNDDALEDDWLFIEADGTLVFAIKERAVCAKTLADAWGAFRELVAV